MVNDLKNLKESKDFVISVLNSERLSIGFKMKEIDDRYDHHEIPPAIEEKRHLLYLRTEQIDKALDILEGIPNE